MELLKAVIGIIVTGFVFVVGGSMAIYFVRTFFEMLSG